MLIEKPIKTKRLILKNLDEVAAEGAYYHWLRDPKVNNFLEVRHNPPSVEHLKQFINKMNHSDADLLLGIHLMNGNHIGNIKLGPMHFFYSRAVLGLMIGDQNQWGQGYASEAIMAVTDYAFNDLNLLSVRAGCYANNKGSLKAFSKAGYKESGRQPQYWKVSDQFVDNVLLVKFCD